MIKPYVGISCITSLEEAKKISQFFLEAGFSCKSKYQGSLGYAITSNIINNLKSTENRYLSIEKLSKIMIQNQDFGMNVLHFVPRPCSEKIFFEDIKKLFIKTKIYSNGLCKTLQLNYGTSVSPNCISTLKVLLSELRIIFQVGEKDLQLTECDLLDLLSRYSENVDMFLFDPSQGKGKPITNEYMNKFKFLSEKIPRIQIGFAGGLTPNNLQEKIKHFKKISDTFSIDTESGVRFQLNDRLDLTLVQKFIMQAAECLIS